ncbi:hypothetical protein D3C75_905540 [compost metagenome]
MAPGSRNILPMLRMSCLPVSFGKAIREQADPLGRTHPVAPAVQAHPRPRNNPLLNLQGRIILKQAGDIGVEAVMIQSPFGD